MTRLDKTALFEKLRFDERGLVAAIAQDAKSGKVLMMAWMDREAIELTLETRDVHYYSRSRQCLWRKGETSGNTQTLRSMAVDCDGDALLLKVDKKGPACHTGNESCFYRAVDGKELA